MTRTRRRAARHSNRWPRSGPTKQRESCSLSAVDDPDGSARGVAAGYLAQTHSEFGRLLFNRHMNSMPFYVDPHVPLPPEPH